MSPRSESLALAILTRLQAAGHTAYLAGGCVRDRLMNRPPKDFDVATSAKPTEVLALFPRAQEVGAAFGVILIREKSDADGPVQVEVATFRSDGNYSDGRHPDSVRFTTAQEDAQRRDFTCNGLFLDPLANNGEGQLHDFVGGQADIAAKKLRAIGDPAARFREDHLRMLRAVRFASRLNFTVDAATREAIRTAAPAIKTISKERVHDELARILSHETRVTGVQLLEQTGLLVQLWPHELLEGYIPATTDRWRALSKLPAQADFVVALATLHEALKTAAIKSAQVAEFLRRDLMLANTESEDLAWLLEKHEILHSWPTLRKSTMKRLIADPRWPRLAWMFATNDSPPTEFTAFEKQIAELRAEPGGVAPAHFVTGETLIALGAAPGPKFKRWLEELYDRQLENEFATAEQAAAAAKQLIGA